MVQVWPVAGCGMGPQLPLPVMSATAVRVRVTPCRSAAAAAAGLHGGGTVAAVWPYSEITVMMPASSVV